MPLTNEDLLVAVARLEERVITISKNVDTLTKSVDSLETQAQWVRGGIILIVAIGGIVTWLANIFGNLFGKS